MVYQILKKLINGFVYLYTRAQSEYSNQFLKDGEVLAYKVEHKVSIIIMPIENKRKNVLV